MSANLGAREWERAATLFDEFSELDAERREPLGTIARVELGELVE